MTVSEWMGKGVKLHVFRYFISDKFIESLHCSTQKSNWVQHLLFELFSGIVSGICDGLNILILRIWLDPPVHVHLGLLFGLHSSNIHVDAVVVVVEEKDSRIEVSNNKLSEFLSSWKKRKKTDWDFAQLSFFGSFGSRAWNTNANRKVLRKKYYCIFR